MGADGGGAGRRRHHRPAASRAGTTRLYLAGPRAGEIASLFKGSALETVEMPGDVGTASALKMAYAAWTKGSSALLIAVRALAIREGVDGALRAEWERSQPGLGGRSESAVAANAKKAWRFVGEMEEIAATFAAAGLPAGFHEACAASMAVSTATRTRRRRRRSPRWPRRSAPRERVGASRSSHAGV